jgi:hypothetical protein
MSLESLALPSGVETEGDSLPGSGPTLLPTGIYSGKLKLVYLDESQGGAKNVNIRFITPDGQEHRETIYITSGRAKGQKTTYTDRRTGKERPLPGYSLVDEICIAATGNNLASQTSEAKKVKIWDYDAKEEVVAERQVITSLLGQDIQLGIQHIRENKNVKNDNNQWVPGPDAREFNEINKAFNPAGLTNVEVTSGATEAKFQERWGQRFPAGEMIDKFDPSIAESAPPAATEAALPNPVESLDDDDIFD